MSRRSAQSLFALFAAVLAAPDAGHAQTVQAAPAIAPASGESAPSPGAAETDGAIAERMLRGGGLGLVKRNRCGQRGPGGEIVVCATDNSAFRVRSTGDLDPNGSGANDGQLRAPDLAQRPAGVSVAKGCFVPPCPPEAAYMIDLSTIPEAPAGSEADQIAKGELRDR